MKLGGTLARHQRTKPDIVDIRDGLGNIQNGPAIGTLCPSGIPALESLVQLLLEVGSQTYAVVSWLQIFDNL